MYTTKSYKNCNTDHTCQKKKKKRFKRVVPRDAIDLSKKVVDLVLRKIGYTLRILKRILKIRINAEKENQTINTKKLTCDP